MARGVGLVATRGAARRLVALVVMCSGLWVAFWTVFTDVSGALDDAAAKAAGVSSAHATSPQTGVWGWVCIAGGTLIVAGGWLAYFYGDAWPTMGSRYERSGARTGRPLDTWAALDQGIDPTADPDSADPGRMQS